MVRHVVGKDGDDILLWDINVDKNGDLVITVKDSHGLVWNVLTINTDGTFYRNVEIPVGSGLSVDTEGRIQERVG